MIHHFCKKFSPLSNQSRQPTHSILTPFCELSHPFAGHHALLRVITPFCELSHPFASHHALLRVNTSFCESSRLFPSYHTLLRVITPICESTHSFASYLVIGTKGIKKDQVNFVIFPQQQHILPMKMLFYLNNFPLPLYC